MAKLRNTGFEGQVFLSRAEWQTYLKRMPVRYIKKAHDPLCAVCGQPATPSNPFNHSHVIGFGLGVAELGLTPDFLDSPTNIRTAHRTSCNLATELSISAAISTLVRLGHINAPDYLPTTTRTRWAEAAAKQSPSGEGL